MEVFSLLKYWKGGGGGGGGGVQTGCSTSSTASFVTAAGEPSDGDDDGPFFDLEFTDEEAQKLERGNEIIHEEGEEEEENDVVRRVEGAGELKFGGLSCPNVTRIAGASAAVEEEEEEINSGPFRNSDSPVPTATKLRMLMLRRLKRSKSESTATTQSQTQAQSQNQQNNNKLFTVKFKTEVPIMSLLSRASSNSKVNTEHPAPESYKEKRNKREAMQKYLKMVKPPHLRVPKRHQEDDAAAMTAAENAIKRLNLRKNSGKSKSAVVHSVAIVASKRRDDSLLQEEEGIQSAILHCKRSFNASRGISIEFE